MGSHFHLWESPISTKETLVGENSSCEAAGFPGIVIHAMGLSLVKTTSSDHTPVILWPRPKFKGGKYFRFEAFWEEHEECGDVIQQGWYQSSNNSQVWDSFLIKAKNCKSSLQRWHQQTFRRADKQISHLNQELQKILNTNTVEFGNNWEKVQQLRGNWVQGYEEIEKLVLGHYSEVYKSENTEGINDCLLNLPKKADPTEALRLTKILNSFSKASGQRVNLAKSGVIFGGGVPLEGGACRMGKIKDQQSSLAKRQSSTKARWVERIPPKSGREGGTH
ncbi:hypothetical protein SESBI_39352 [Sesbania bispinosa]|nr:hypothetical protein SESBI_39352 [Sesbania bispinosa]